VKRNVSERQYNWNKQRVINNILKVTKIQKKHRTWTDSLVKRPKRKKMDMRFSTWNVRSMYKYKAGSLRAVGGNFQSTS
jgi:hypothetical protein